jgi:hypothetical protein
MPQRDDDEFDDDRPLRRPRDGDDYERPRRRRDEDDDGLPRKKSSTGLVVGILVGVFVICCGGGGTLAYLVFRGIKKGVEQVTVAVQDATEAEQSRQNLLVIGRAAQQYHDAQGSLPNNSYDVRNGQVRPLLSWRVHLLPYVGEPGLYREFKLDEPWDSLNNRKLLSRLPAVYAAPEARKKAGEGKTFYRGFTAPGGIFEKATANNPNPRVRLTDIMDGTMNTILVVEAGDAVEWTKPDDLDFAPGRPRPTFGGAYPNLPFALVLMADGTVHHMRKDVPDDTLRKLIDRKDGAIIPPGWEQ